MLKNQNANLLVINRGLMLAVFGLILVILMLAYWMGRAMDARAIALPPDLRSGAVIHGNEVYPETVYAFTFAIFQQLNRWRTDGTSEYGQNIARLRDYLTPQFRVVLDDDRSQRQRDGELRDRTRGIFIPPEVVYESSRVEIVSPNEWLVNLEVELLETIDDAPVKQARILYPIRVVRYEMDWERNPWGLALDGFAKDGPVRLEDLVARR